MKQAYTTYNPALKKLARDLFDTGLNLEQIVTLVMDGPAFEDYDKIGLFIDNEIIKGRCRHVFMPELAFCDWLSSAAPPTNGETLRQLFEDVLGGGVPIVMHFPTANKMLSFAFVFHESALYVQDSLNGVNTFHGLIRFDGPVNTINSYMGDKTRFLMGMGAYCTCFPEVVIDGIPDDCKHPAHHRYHEANVITVANEIKESTGTHASPVGHFRAGHFRLLQSPKFTRKRFQSIFVRQTFVNGYAKTVLAPEELKSP